MSALGGWSAGRSAALSAVGAWSLALSVGRSVGRSVDSFACWPRLAGWLGSWFTSVLFAKGGLGLAAGLQRGS